MPCLAGSSKPGLLQRRCTASRNRETEPLAERPAESLGRISGRVWRADFSWPPDSNRMNGTRSFGTVARNARAGCPLSIQRKRTKSKSCERGCYAIHCGVLEICVDFHCASRFPARTSVISILPSFWVSTTVRVPSPWSSENVMSASVVTAIP